ncbi:phBC6A51 family helix-turn-helix protein [Paenibacillus pinihumi]|uniref:phBC6A51 family helix-turn-helix protein n=1 Tax=Paenibacillus pinihumi TaxID=669462 RepID=UPI00048ED875|nr:phBC6A51 family helix-turn-helix protein [Paenibacillus pinihumi]
MSAAKRKQLESRLDGRQKVAALAVVERDFAPEDERKGFEEIAAEVGVSRNTLYEWRTQNKAFIDYANSLADDFLTGKRSLVYRKLMQLIDSSQPSVKAIDLFMKREGLITAQVAVETKDAGAARSNEELVAEIADIDELLKDE